MSITITVKKLVNVPDAQWSYDENGTPYTTYSNVLRDVSVTCNTPLDYLRAKGDNEFNATFVDTLLKQVSAPLAGMPYAITPDAILIALNTTNLNNTFSYTNNYADIVARAIANALTTNNFKGDDWYNTPQVQSMIQAGAADALVRIHAYDGEQFLRDYISPYGAPVDALMPRWKSVCISANISLKDLASGAGIYFTQITNPNGNSQWWGTEAWFRVPLQGYSRIDSTFNYSQYVNMTAELAQQKQLGDQLMAAQKANGGDDWAIIGFIVGIGIMIATGGSGILGVITDSINASSAAASAAEAIIATENAIDIASVLADASATVAAESQVVALANQSALSLASDAATAVSQATNTISLASDAAQSFVDATQTLSTSANDVVNVTEQAQNIIDNHAQVIEEAINNVQNNTLPISDTGLPINETATVPDWTNGYDLPQGTTTAANAVPSITNNIQQIADQIAKKITSLSPSQALSLATTAFKLVSGGGSSGQPAVYTRNPNAPSTYDQFLAYYNSLNESNNYGIKGNIGPLIDQIGMPLLILAGAYALSKR